MNGEVLVTTLVGLIVASAAYCHMNKKDIHEGFHGLNTGHRTWKVDKIIAKDHHAARKGDFVSIPNFQATLAPRFSGMESYGANIRYNMPEKKHQGVPCHPLTFADHAGGSNGAEHFTQENMTCGQQGCGVADCGRGGVQSPMTFGSPPPEAGYASGNYNEEIMKAHAGPGGMPAAESTVPVGDMTVVDAMGQTVQPIVYDRYIYANRNSRLRGLGDMIRGDLPIVPCAAEWFRPSVHPHIDLQQGALNVVAGWNNDTAQATAALIHASSGNADTTIGGANVSSQLVGSTGLDGSVQISSFA